MLLLSLSLLLLSSASASSPPQNLQILIQDNTLKPSDVSDASWIDDPCCPNGLNAVQWAAKLGSKAMPTLLRAGGSATLWHEATQTSPVHFASREGSWQSLKELLESLDSEAAAGEIARGDEHGNNAAHLAALTGQVSVLTLLRKVAGEGGAAFLTAVNGNGNTPLQIACFFNHPKFTERLLESAPVKLSLGALAPNGRSALMLAASGNCAACVELLLAAGADKSEVGPDGVGPLEIAREKGNAEVVRLLEEQEL